MNLLLLRESDFVSDTRAVVGERRAAHLIAVKKAVPGMTIPAGRINGNIGQATITHVSQHSIEIDLDLMRPPPDPLPLTLILALPRPKVLRRLVQSITTFGIKHLVIMRTWHVEKSYWQSPFLAHEQLEKRMILGLEQAGDTMMPRVEFRKRFRPFVEDELPRWITGSSAIVADPGAPEACGHGLKSPVVAAIGPESGFTPAELDMLTGAGFARRNLGERTIRVEEVVGVLVGRLF